MTKPDVSLIIPVYKDLRALRLIMIGLQRQSFQNFEVIIAEDNIGDDMTSFLEDMRLKMPFTIKHTCQPDEGFRKCRALNAAIKIAESDYLVFLDGDCLPHRHFLRAHFNNKQEDTALWGRRVMLSEQLTSQIYRSLDKAYGLLTFFQLWLSGSKRLDCSIYMPFLPKKISKKSAIWGCNWSLHKANIMAVNGFDENYTSPGFGEDTDIEWRLLQSGVSLKKIKNEAIQYHLHHPENYSNTRAMEEIFARTKREKAIITQNGLEKRLPFY